MGLLGGKLAILGAGGHASVVADAALASGYSRVAFFANERSINRNLQGPFLGGLDALKDMSTEFSAVHVAIGSNAARRSATEQLTSMGFDVASVIHPSSVVSPSVKIYPGVSVLANAVVNSGSTLGTGCIVNTGSIVEHDCILGPFSHISPGAVMAGGALLGSGSWIGMGASVLPLVEVGSSVTVGAGAVVLNNVADSLVVHGVPAKVRGRS